jgi:hypothetical protein
MKDGASPCCTAQDTVHRGQIRWAREVPPSLKGYAQNYIPIDTIIAVAHSIVVSAFHMLIRDEPYRELGAHYFDDRRQAHLVDQLTRRIERLGYRVTLEPVAAA